MRVALDVDALRREMARRGLTGAELAAIAGVSAATVSHAQTGRMIDHGTIRKLGRALTVTPVIPAIDHLIGNGFKTRLQNESGAEGPSPSTPQLETADATAIPSDRA
jgi:transcriptional regulator with XRE-family HTH domain